MEQNGIRVKENLPPALAAAAVVTPAGERHQSARDHNQIDPEIDGARMVNALQDCDPLDLQLEARRQAAGLAKNAKGSPAHFLAAMILEAYLAAGSGTRAAWRRIMATMQRLKAMLALAEVVEA
jgi:hypothetical protein